MRTAIETPVFVLVIGALLAGLAWGAEPVTAVSENAELDTRSISTVMVAENQNLDTRSYTVSFS